MHDALTAEEVAYKLGCSTSQVYALNAEGILPGYKMFNGRKGWRWEGAVVESYLTRRKALSLNLNEGNTDNEPVQPWKGILKLRGVV